MKPALERVRRPEYTGDRRCWPCTGLNAALLAVGVAVVWTVSLPFALALATLGTAVIWLRGYLVPYTPQFAPRLVAALPWMDGYREEQPTGSTTLAEDGEIDGEAVVEALLDAGVVTAGPDGATLELDEAFRERWRAEIERLRDLDDDALAAAVLAAALGAAAAEPHTRGDRTRVILDDGSGRIAGETWLARPVAIAEAGAVRALAETVPEGEDALFAAAARPLRTFLQRCPVCDGAVIETTTSACCGGAPSPMASPTRDVLACEDCDRRVYTFERDAHATE
jgi:hypothetical protein